MSWEDSCYCIGIDGKKHPIEQGIQYLSSSSSWSRKQTGGTR